MTAITHPEAYERAVAVTPNDSVDLPNGVCKGLYIGGTGNVTVQGADGDQVTFNAVAVGILPFTAKRVLATGTAATNIVALY